MTFNIEQFTSQIDDRGLQKNNKFIVQFTPPSFILNNVTGGGVGDAVATFNDLRFWCEGAAIPGVQIAQRQVLHYGYGPVKKRPFAPVFNDMTFVFIGDGQTINWGIFQNWVNTVNMFDARFGVNPQQQTIAPFEIFYPIDYKTDVRVIAYQERSVYPEDQTMNIVLRDAFPHTIQDLPLSWADNNTIMRIPVTFTFTDWYWEPQETSIETPPVTPLPFK